MKGLEQMGGNHWLNGSKTSVAFILGTAERVEIAHRLIDQGSRLGVRFTGSRAGAARSPRG